MSPARPRLHLIDGSGYIFRAYYAVRPLQSRKGVPTNALIGFCRMLLRLLREAAPTHLGIAFDTGEPTFRHLMYDQYKAHRDAPPEDLVPQFALIHSLVEAMNIPMLKVIGYEADDLLATLTHQAVAAGYDVELVSGDKDLMQLVGDHVTMFDPLKEQHFDRAAVIAKFGVPPEHVADILALAGDSSDNIPGVPKVGGKGAAKLVQAYGDVEAIIAGLAALPRPKAAEASVLAHVDSARLSKRLAQLCTTAPVTLDLDKLRYGQPDAPRLSALLIELDAQSLLRDFNLAPASLTTATVLAAAAASSGALQETSTAPLLAPEIFDRASYRTLWTEAELQEVIDAAGAAGRVSVDLETTSKVAMRAEVVGIALCVPGQPAVYVPVAHSGEDARRQLAPQQALELLRPLLEDARIAKVGQNLKYDWVVLAQAGIELRGIRDDAMIAAYILDPTRPSYGMDTLSRDLLGHTTLTYKEVTEDRRGDHGFVAVPVDRATAYAGEDADVALRLCERLRPQLAEVGGTALYEDLEIPLVPLLARMERHGIAIDSDVLTDLSAEFGTRLRHLEDEAFALIGAPINLASPKQLAELFFVKLGYPAVKRTKTGYSTDQEVLETLARTYDLPRLVLAHRTLAKLKSTYIDALQRLAVAGRVHTSFNQTGTATGRLSSSDPNLQNIPIRSDDGRRIRAAFIAPPGCLLISADYSQIELRVLAHLSQDPTFIAAFIAGEDIHRQTAMAILSHGQPPTAEMRRQAKAINFGIIYGLSEFGLARQLNIGRADARLFISAYFARYPEIQHYMDSTIERARRDGYVATLTGRRRALPDLRSQNGNVRQGAERIAKNTPIQGSAADLIKMAMLQVQARLDDHHLKTRLLLQVHDELVLEAPEAEVEAASRILREEMTQVMPLRVPLLVEVGQGRTWAEAH